MTDTVMRRCKPIRLTQRTLTDDTKQYVCGHRKGFTIYGEAFTNTLGEKKIIFVALKKKPRNDNILGQSHMEAEENNYSDALHTVDYDQSIADECYGSITRMIDNAIGRKGK